MDRKSVQRAESTRQRLLVFRIFAWVTGVVLLGLTVGMVFKYGFGDGTLVRTIGPVHGFLYMGYIVATLMLADRCRWEPKKAVLVLLAGTVPLASFVAERKVTREVRGVLEQEQATPLALWAVSTIG